MYVLYKKENLLIVKLYRIVNVADERVI